MTMIKGILFLAFMSFFLGGAMVHAQSSSGIPEKDIRIKVRDLNSPCKIPQYDSLQGWLSRMASLRKQILVSAGLWPLPPKAPLNSEIFGRIDYEDYSIEKVYFESHPGFYVTGNLYRPLGKQGPFPAILSPHGHWPYGRFASQVHGSVPARAVHFARQGAIVFSYDMVGYNDSFQVSHSFRGAEEELWSVGLLGLQLWNSIRVVDFLLSLPEVDKSRLAATGASGGATQTFLLTAIDDRIKVSAPVNMISGHMQGGSICENAPGLRIDTCNIEIGAMMAPRPMLMVSATGDWTTDTPRIEYPGIRHIYELYGKQDRISNEHFHAPHNYNKESREAVYAWFDRWLLGQNFEEAVKEKTYRPDRPSKQMVFFGRALPEAAKTEQELVKYLIQSAHRQLESLKPKNAKEVERFRRVFEPSLRYALMVKEPDSAQVLVENKAVTSLGEVTQEDLLLSYRGSRISAVLWHQGGVRSRPAALLVHPQGTSAFIEMTTNQPGTLVKNLLRRKFSVLTIDTFKPLPIPADGYIEERGKFFSTYNRSDDAKRIQDILTALVYLEGRRGISGVNLVGVERGGLLCLLARGLTSKVKVLVADAQQFNIDDDQRYLRDLSLPGIRRAGDFRTAVTLSSPGRLLLHNTGGSSLVPWAQDVYKATGFQNNLEVLDGKVSEKDLVRWLQSLR